MVHKLSVKEVVEVWELFMKGARTVFEMTEEDEKQLFNKCLTGISQLWAGYGDDEKVPIYMIVSTLSMLPASGTKSLFLSHLYSVSEDSITLEAWKDGFEVIVKFAKENACTRLDCIASNPLVVDIFKSVSSNVIEHLYLIAKL